MNLLNLYYRQDSWTTNYQDISKLDYSLGSSIFSVTPPKADMLWYGNKVLIGDSPYVISYSEEGYEQIKKMQEDDEKAINDYWGSQPEINESDFQKQLQEARKRAEKNTGNKVMEIWELAKYRLNKRIPNNLTFEERKKLLINSAEWNGLIYKNNNRIKEEENKGSHGRVSFWALGIGSYDSEELFGLTKREELIQKLIC